MRDRRGRIRKQNYERQKRQEKIGELKEIEDVGEERRVERDIRGRRRQKML